MQPPISTVITALATPAEAAALFRLDVLTPPEMVGLCERWLLEDLDKGCAEVAWLAAQTDPILSEVRESFEQALRSLTGEPPALDDAARIAVRLYARAIADGVVATQEGMRAFDKDLDALFWERRDIIIRAPEPPEAEDKLYVGSQLGANQLYIWYRELQDAEDGSMLFYYNDLPRDEQLEKFRWELRNEARRLAELLETPLGE